MECNAVDVMTHCRLVRASRIFDACRNYAALRYGLHALRYGYGCGRYNEGFGLVPFFSGAFHDLST